MPTGYIHAGYANSFQEFGVPIKLTQSQGWALKRQIAGTPYCDAMTCYPLLVCQNWDMLGADLDDLEGDLVSIAVVTDPFGDYDETLLKQAFLHKVIPFKTHFIIELAENPENYISRHHRRYARKALRSVTVEICEHPIDFLDDWITCYQTLIERHHIRGIARFSPSSFSKQLQVPGLTMVRASYQGQTVGIILWCSHQNIGYYHLGAYTALGYQLKASFALFWQSIIYFSDLGFTHLNLGAGAGISREATDGLSRFKRDWSNDTRLAYFCGRIFDCNRYETLATSKNAQDDTYFPIYRKGEFG